MTTLIKNQYRSASIIIEAEEEAISFAARASQEDEFSLYRAIAVPNRGYVIQVLDKEDGFVLGYV